MSCIAVYVADHAIVIPAIPSILSRSPSSARWIMVQSVAVIATLAVRSAKPLKLHGLVTPA